MSKGLVNIECRVYAPTSFSGENKVEMTAIEGVKNPKFEALGFTKALFTPKYQIKKSTLDFLLLNQGKSVTLKDMDRPVTVILENIPAEFIKGYKKTTGERYYSIIADLSAEPGEEHKRAFYCDGMTVKMCEKFITEHTFDEASYDVEAMDETEAGVATEKGENND